MSTQKLIAAALVALLLAACGGGDDPTRCIGGVEYDASGTPKAAEQAGAVTRLESC